MIGLIQRVTQARVDVAGSTVGEIGPGLLALVCAERGDTEAESVRLLDKLLGYRVFSDAAGKMNLSLRQRAAAGEAAGLLIVSQFTLAADTRSGARPSFTPAADPATGQRLYEHFVAEARRQHGPQGQVATGIFAADMQVSLTNDGPVTFWLRIPPPGGAA
ncbi:D-tyrosyl-tRNA(Tyr) deacylase [Imbroritus primus]|uniref:D-tyrosyl-tRNA(Tyr) deacylase n=1 Tax=Imbroritus primus TaxID=3058603 RepID=A0ACD3ST97_9BURK|nr:D-tyrosyl-tRNA(Tyr) deacylase [Burkholderiaceae bacterium PBA]